VTTVALIITATLFSAECSNSVSDDPEVAAGLPLQGVLGQVAGVVYDKVTGAPVANADVTIPGYAVVKTAADGSYLINNVAAGTYTVTIVKQDYAFTSRTVFVDPEAYTKIDPFKEYKVLKEEIKLFTKWLTTTNIPDYTGLTGLSDINWTYSDGVYTNGDGDVIYNEAEKQFEWSGKKLNDVYSHTVPLGLVSLAPFNASLSARIELVFAPYSVKSSVTAPVNNVAPVAAGVKVWLVDTDSIIGQSVGSAPAFQPSHTDVNSKALYGPFATGADGKFTADDLPSRTNFTLLIEKFTQDYDSTTFYFDNSKFYAAPANTALTDITTTGLATNSGEAAVNAGKLYLFTVGDVAFVTGSNVSNAGAPLGVDAAITLTFSKDIDTASFSASISLNASNTTATPWLAAPRCPGKPYGARPRR
jgi:hypothetical protein